MTSKTEQDAQLSGAKIDPFDRTAKHNTNHARDHGAIGEDEDIRRTQIHPLDSSAKAHHKQAPHADSQGVVGYEDVVQGSKIAPMEGGAPGATKHDQGLTDESIDKSRINPIGGLREDE
ncbi:hypothetical protein CC78DRAFT_292168 [Lojkania enalia]|uniref:Uncharacterized protein n=1 Tax=Lojkania enalia TaxID=147567 RepID=A0A9P4N7V8_9PLEO|nr:hypothetical protein CC78DRAFT_292168 [Didymosphaeria enalia]